MDKQKRSRKDVAGETWKGFGILGHHAVILNRHGCKYYIDSASEARDKVWCIPIDMCGYNAMVILESS